MIELEMIELNLEGEALRMYLRAQAYQDTRGYRDHYDESEFKIFWYEGTGIIRHNEPGNDLTHFFEFETRARKWEQEPLDESILDEQIKNLRLVEERKPMFYDEIIRNILARLQSPKQEGEKSDDKGKIVRMDFHGFNPIPERLIERGFAYNSRGRIETILPIT